MSQTPLFDEIAAHDPGGKIRSALPPGVRGDAVLVGDKHRPVLRRWLGDAFPARYVVFIGMNPSTAIDTINDPTITREWGYATSWGYTGFVKTNLSDYRATNPKGLLDPAVVLRSSDYWDHVTGAVNDADLVVACWGSVNRRLRPLAEQMNRLLQGRAMCFGKNADGSPKHPLYLRKDAALSPL